MLLWWLKIIPCVINKLIQLKGVFTAGSIGYGHIKHACSFLWTETYQRLEALFPGR